jgi:hypothetical protein
LIPGTTPAPKYCQLSHVTRTLRTKDGCVAPDAELTLCAGACPSMQQLVLEPPYTVDNCACCQGLVETKEVEFTCPDGRPSKTVKVPYHASCGCEHCVNAE